MLCALPAACSGTSSAHEHRRVAQRLLSHVERLAEEQLGLVLIVCAAAQLNIVDNGQSTCRVRLDVMKFEKRRLRAPAAAVSKCTAALVALPDFTPDRRRNVTRPTVCAAGVFDPGVPDRGAASPLEIRNQ